MKKLISGILTLALLVSMMTFTLTASANTSPVIASDIMDSSTFTEASYALKDNSTLATAGTGWNGSWVKDESNIGSATNDFTANNVIKKVTLSNDTGYYFGFGTTVYHYYRGLSNPISTTTDGIYYTTVTMANTRTAVHASHASIAALFSLANSTDNMVTVGIEQLVNSTTHYLTVGRTATQTTLTPNTAYDFLIKLVVDADGADKVFVEVAKKGEGFTGNWNSETETELGTDPLNCVHYQGLGFATGYFKDVAIEAYSADAIASANDLVSGASKNDFLARIAQLDTVLPNGVQKTLTKAAIKAEAGINAYDYLDFPEVTTDGVSLIGSETYRNGGEGWRSGWTTGTSVSAATGTQGNRNLKKVGDKNYISLDSNEVFVRRWFNNISTATDGKYAIDCTLMLYSNAMNASGTAAGPIVYIGEGDSDMAEKISFGIHGNDINNRSSGLPFLKVGDTTVWGTRAMTSTSGAFKFSLEITIDADGAETFNLKVAQLGNNYTDNFANLTVTDSTNFANTNLSYMELKSPAFGGSKFADFVIYEKKNILSIGYPRFYQNGAEVSKADLTNAPVTVKINVDNTTNTPVTGKLLMGAYSGAQMVGCAISPSTFSFAKGQSGVAELTYTPSEDVTLSSDNGLTVFMWNNLTPIMAKESIR